MTKSHVQKIDFTSLHRCHDASGHTSITLSLEQYNMGSL